MPRAGLKRCRVVSTFDAFSSMLSALRTPPVSHQHLLGGEAHSMHFPRCCLHCVLPQSVTSICCEQRPACSVSGRVLHLTTLRQSVQLQQVARSASNRFAPADRQGEGFHTGA